MSEPQDRGHRDEPPEHAEIIAILDTFEEQLSTIASDAHPENTEERLADIRRELDYHGEKWIPFKLGNLTRVLAEGLQATGEHEAAITWFDHSVAIWTRCVALAPEPVNHERLARVRMSRDSATADHSPAEAGRATAVVKWQAPPDGPLGFLGQAPGQVGRDAALSAAAEKLSSIGTVVGSATIAARCKEFGDRVCRMTAVPEPVNAVIGPIMDADTSRIVQIFGESSLPPDPQQILRLAAYARRAATPRDIQPTDATPRLWWLLAGACNLELAEGTHRWTANAPNIVNDQLGYLTAVVIQHRYDDSARDFLTGSAELLVAASISMPPAFWPKVARWCRTAIGLYMALRGPSPSTPAATMYDERVRHVDRDDWARGLLDLYKNGRSDEQATATVALCQVAGEVPQRLDWLLNLIFGPESDRPDAADLAYWLERGLAFMRTTGRLRMVSNPWAETLSNGGASVSTLVARRSADGKLCIPSRLVQHAAAEVLRHNEAVSINGKEFAGRRVPTFLLRDSSGPFGLLKIDTEEKVNREHANFSSAAQRLHWNNRPGLSERGNLAVYLADDGTPLRAIVTSHVFGEEDTPTTLSDWLRRCDADAAAMTIERLFLGALRPWIAYVTRERVDLRMQYPVLRPRTPTRGSYAPSQSSVTELQRLTQSVTWANADGLGLQMEGFGTVLNAAGDAHDVRLPSCCTATADPVWLARQLAAPDHASVAPEAAALLDAIIDFETFVARCHGDLHGDNVLCLDTHSDRPRLVIIDFESTHTGHVCKDFARLEAALLCQLHDWDHDQRERLLEWFAAKPVGSTWTADVGSADGDEPASVVMHCSQTIRSLARRCGQGHWGISPVEYSVALLGALIPMARYTTVSAENRILALALAGMIAAELCAAAG